MHYSLALTSKYIGKCNNQYEVDEEAKAKWVPFHAK